MARGLSRSCPIDGLMAQALCARPFISGLASNETTAEPPADCPKIVTLLLLPPNTEMLRCTQRNADNMSSVP